MSNLLHSFGRTQTFVKSTGYILFEKSVVGTYSFVIPQTREYVIDVVGGGGGAFLPNTSLSFTGGSGGHSSATLSLTEGDVLTVYVGGHGVSKKTDSTAVASAGTGGTSYVKLNNQTLCEAYGGTGGGISSNSGGIIKYYWGTGGYGNMQSGNPGTNLSDISTQITPGGASVYNGYGAGAGVYGNTYATKTPILGTAGYVKIAVA